MTNTQTDSGDELLCGNASDNIYLTFKGGCCKGLTYQECYRCTSCGGRFHKDCILEHFELEEPHDWGRQQERELSKAREREAEKRGELYGRANEHHVISGMLSNEELGKLDPSTIRRLKRRKEEITQQRYPNPQAGDGGETNV